MKQTKVKLAALVTVVAAVLTGCNSTPEVTTAETVEFVAPVKTGEPSPVVLTTKGNIQGLTRNGVNFYLGIPYAQSISGENRFLPPKSVKEWDELNKQQDIWSLHHNRQV